MAISKWSQRLTPGALEQCTSKTEIRVRLSNLFPHFIRRLIVIVLNALQRDLLRDSSCDQGYF